jgi:hypothetical protein
MDAKMFITKMRKLLPGADAGAVRSLACHALEAERGGDYTCDMYFKEAYVEFALIKRRLGLDIARQLLSLCETFTLYPHELRGAANHLRRGVAPERIGPLALDGKCERTQSESLEFENAMELFENRFLKSQWKRGGSGAYGD